MLQTQGSSISVIIEWKNQDLATDDRADAMLTALRDQWLALQVSKPESESGLPGLPFAPCMEILFIYDSPQSRHNLEHQIRGRFTSYTDDFALHLINGSGLIYYQMKQRGADHASGDILIFLDSDVIPEHGWLDALLDSLLTDGIQVVCGNTYIEPTGLLGKAFALGWIFPLRSTSGGLEVGARCYANNFAVRRELFLRYPFEIIPGTNRSVMNRLQCKLELAGIHIHKCHAAQVSHPAPNGLHHVIRRAMAQGRDIYLQSNHGYGSIVDSRHLVGALQQIWGRYTDAVSRVLQQYERVELSPLMIPVILMGITLYYSSSAAASLFTHIAPKPMSRWFQL